MEKENFIKEIQKIINNLNLQSLKDTNNYFYFIGEQREQTKKLIQQYHGFSSKKIIPLKDSLDFIIFFLMLEFIFCYNN